MAAPAGAGGRRQPPPPPPPPAAAAAAQQQRQKPSSERSKWWWALVCAVAYELRPFTPPTRHEVIQFYHSTRQTLRLLAREGAAAARVITGAAATHLTWRRVLPLAAYVALQWLAARVEFGLVFFILAMLALIFTVGLGDDASRQGRGGERLSPWSVFNQGMRSILGTIDPAQFEAEIRNYGLEAGGLGEQMLLRRGGENDGRGRQQQQQQRQRQQEPQEQEQEQEQGGPARKTGKKARRKYDKEERRRRRLGGAGGAGAGGVGEDGWQEDWASDED